jgi:hypothetical protein
VFTKKNVDILPNHQPHDYTVDLEKGVQLLSIPNYNLSQDKVATLREYIYNNFEKGFIWHSKFLVGILFVNKIWFFMNVSWLSWIKSTHHKKLVPFTFDLKVIGLELNHAKVYTKIDLHGTHNLVCIQEGNEWKWVGIVQKWHKMRKI